MNTANCETNRRTKIMNRKTILSLAAAAALSIGFASAAKADPSVSFGFGIGGGGQPSFAIGVSDGGYYGGGYPGYWGHHHHYGYYDAGYDGSSCYMVKSKHWVWNPAHTFKFPVISKQLVCD
jgi:hypothetical protein